MEPALKLTTPAEQATFPWAEPGSRKLLGVCPGDVETWRVRLDIERIRFVAIDEKWARDRRWQEFTRLVRQDGLHTVLECTAGLALLVLELVRNKAAMGLQDATTDPVANVVREWGLPDKERQTLLYSAQRAIAVGILRLVDEDAFPDHAAYPKYQSRATARHCAPLRGVDGRTSTDGQTDATTDGTTTGAAENSPPREITAAAKNDDGLASELGRRRGDGKVDAIRDSVTIAEWCIRRRSSKGKSPYPANRRDSQDILAAVTKARTLPGELRVKIRLNELCEMLGAVLDWCDSGAAVRSKLREEGFL